MTESDPMARPRYTGVATFMRTPYRPDADGVEVGLVGVPFDGGVTNRPGARLGPREIRSQSTLMRKINQSTGVCPYDLCAVADVGDVLVEKPFHLESSLGEIHHQFAKLHGKGVVPVSTGGDHSISLPILRAIAAERPVSMVQIDAHCDTGDDYLGSRFHHGAPFRRAVEEGLLDPARVVQIGIRGGLNDANQWAFSHDTGMRVIYMEEFHRMGVEAAIAEARRVVGDGPAYVSFDIDGLDPAYALGTGTPEVGGLTTLEGQLLVRGLRGLDLIGADVVEVAPPFDPSGATALAGASMLFELLCVVAEATAARRSA